MYFFLFPLFWVLSHSVSFKKTQLILDQSQPKFCKNCIHFIKPKDGNMLFGKCKLYFDYDLVTGDKKTLFASINRLTECGPEGQDFTPKKKYIRKKIT